MKNTMKKLTALAAASALTLSLAACGGGTAANTQSSSETTAPTDGVTETSPSAIKVAVVKQMDHASLDEIANAVTARLDEIAAETGTPIEYEVYSGQNDQTVLRQLGDQAIADGVSGLNEALAALAQQGIQMIYDETYMVLAQGNFVLAVSEGTYGGEPTSYYDLWRVESGKIAEHWDVMETIADQSTWQNDNGKF